MVLEMIIFFADASRRDLETNDAKYTKCWLMITENNIEVIINKIVTLIFPSQPITMFV